MNRVGLRLIALFAAVCLMFPMLFLFSACKSDKNGGDEGGGKEEEYTLELEEGYRQLTIYYHRDAGYENCDIWLWYDSVDGRGYEFHACDYGAKVVVNVPETITTVGYIIRTGCSDPGGTSWGTATKDGTESDRSVTLTGDYTVIYTKAGDANNYSSEDGGKTLKVMKYIMLADMVDTTRIRVVMSDGSFVAKSNLSVTCSDGSEVPITSAYAGLVTLSQEMDLRKSYTLSVTDLDPVTVVPMTYFSSEAFANAYTYDGELGVILSKDGAGEIASLEFRLWAPTASSVTLNLYDSGNGGSTSDHRTLTLGEKGVWTYSTTDNLVGKYYTYTVATSAGVNEAVDPYARSAGLNGARGMIIDLDTTDPAGWVSEPFDNPNVTNYTDAVIWEVHVRDFSNTIASAKYPGKYLAFTETGLTNSAGVPVGVDYLVNLGITHVHLLPVFDYASIDEAANTDDNPANDRFNWGYDPQNYNVPEGSYATDASDGAVRVKEFKQMVQALHNAGISVVMDMVYNHTYRADSNLSKIVPYYYYRYNSNGTLSNGSGCGNETASERSMFRKFMVDSVTYWQTEYNIDGFRFDLMGLHDVTTMREIEEAVHQINPEAILYGEGWTGGGTTKNYTGSLLSNLRAVNAENETNGIAMFSDVIRDAIKGSVFNINDVGFATGANTAYLNNILFGVNGGITNPTMSGVRNSWQAYNPTNVVNYCSAHDNNTLWDRILHVYGADDALNLSRNKLSAAIVETSLGIPFMLAGEEMLRSKVNPDGSFNENSYNASDAVNNLDWEALVPGSDSYEIMQYYRGLIAFRKTSTALRLPYACDAEQERWVCNLVAKDGAFVAFTMTDFDTGEELLVIYNAGTTAYDFTLPAGNWDLYINGEQAGDTPLMTSQSGEESITPVSCYVYRSVD